MKYIELKFKLIFEYKLEFRKDPVVILRSVLGKELRHLACILKNQKNCSDCSLNATCVYSWFFESNIAKSNNVIPGRNKASHPFVPRVSFSSGKTDSITLTMLLLGRSTDYAPYILYALEKAGENGLFKERVKFGIENITSDGVSVFDRNGQQLTLENHIDNWQFSSSDSELYKNERTVKLDFNTPFRFKVGGKYQDSFSYIDFLKSIHRRMGILFELYGEGELLPDLAEVEEKDVIQEVPASSLREIL